MSNIESFISEIVKLQKAYKLLEQLYLEVGPYEQHPVSQETWSEIKDFFDFDDSE